MGDSASRFYAGTENSLLRRGKPFTQGVLPMGPDLAFRRKQRGWSSRFKGTQGQKAGKAPAIGSVGTNGTLGTAGWVDRWSPSAADPFGPVPVALFPTGCRSGRQLPWCSPGLLGGLRFDGVFLGKDCYTLLTVNPAGEFAGHGFQQRRRRKTIARNRSGTMDLRIITTVSGE